MAAHTIEIDRGREDWLVVGRARRRDWNTKEIKKLFRNSGTQTGFRELLWFKYHIPRCSFVTWTASLNKLPTLNRIAAWGIETHSLCSLCKTQDES